MKTTKSFNKYIQLYGPHFTKALCQFAVSMMEDDNGPITPYTKEQVEELLRREGVELKYNKLSDFVYVANMCRADFLGKSVTDDDAHLAQYIKNVIDDPDGYDGQVFNRWLSDVEGLGIKVDWSEFL